MHLRSALLLACLVVVPAIAMFSHKIPREARGFLRSRLLGPIADAAADSLGMGSPPGGPGAGSGAESSSAPPLDGGSDVARTPQAGAAASTSVTPPARFAPSGDAVATVTPMFQRGASDRAAAGRAAVVEIGRAHV